MKVKSAFQPSSSTKAYYMLNNDCVDISGQANNGTPTAITYPQGKFGQAAKFDGSTSKILLPALNVSGNIPRTISAWINASSVSTLGTIYGSGVNTTMNSGSLFTGQATGNVYFSFNGGDVATNNNVIKVNTWYNIVAVYDGGTQTTSTCHIYVNGIAQSLSQAGTPGQTPNTTNSNYSIGILAASSNNFFPGLIDEVIIESRAWTPAEVSTYYRKSMLNYKIAKPTWLNILSVLLTDTITASETLTAIQGKLVQILETITASEVVTTLKGKVVSILDTITSSEIFSALQKWHYTNQTKNTATPTQQTKNNATLTEEQRS